MSHAFKCLRTGRRGTYANHTWPEPGVWVEVEGELVACSNGLHICVDLRQVLNEWLSDELWLVEVDDTADRIDQPGQSVVRRARLVRRLMDKQETRLFAADCAESVLHIFERERPGDGRPRRAIETARAYADGRVTSAELAAARAAARAAAGAAAGASAWASAWAAAWASAWASAWDAAWDAAGAAAWDAAGDAAWDAAWAAAWDAAGAAAWAAAGAAAWAAAWDPAGDAAGDSAGAAARVAARVAAGVAQLRGLSLYAGIGCGR